MGTSFTEIYDLFLSLCEDYHFNELFNISEENLNTYLQPYLRFAVNDFMKCCDQKLQDKMDLENGAFTLVLPEYNKIPLAMLMIKYWFNHLVNDILQIQNKLNDTDFKHFAEANNLNAKKSAYSQMQEECSQLLTDYAILHSVDWGKWRNGIYY